MLLILLTSPHQHPQDNTQAEDNTTVMTTPTLDPALFNERLPLELRRQIFRAYMHSDYSSLSPQALTNILTINETIAEQYQAEFEFQAQRDAARLSQELTTRYPQLDFTVRSPQTFDQAKCLKIEVEMSVANITNLPELLGTFAREVIGRRTLLHTRTLSLRLVPEHPSRTYSTAANRFQTPDLLMFLLGHEVVAKFMDVSQVGVLPVDMA
ncbi:hypothetical protein J4E86_010018 [Alternaria arbusti]|uniref:uncharacterized protein n=1 Tax=Alternaria arbusti TaxID=232088 RepID=UPI00221EA7DD|nr:uncharacterized protein J4E86_010018 [Alternaria arbusti]KAI4943071.1 hypothetical protein J4E86_010018 [Alternaria arbusti]